MISSIGESWWLDMLDDNELLALELWVRYQLEGW